MNAVNLIPADRRKQRFASSTSPMTLGLVGGLVLILLAAVLYVSAVNNVRSKRAQLAHVTSAAAAWNAAAARFDASVQEMQSRTQKLAAVRQLADGRFPWSKLLSQLGSVMPANAALTSMTSTTSSTSASAVPATAAAASTAPTVQLSGCAASQTAVAGAMVALHRIAGVSQVTLTSTSTTAGDSSSSGSGGSGSCPFNVVFQISLTFSAPSAPSSPAISVPSTPAAAAPAGTAAASAAASAATPTTTPAAQ